MSSCNSSIWRALSLSALVGVLAAGCTPAPEQKQPASPESQDQTSPTKPVETGRNGKAVLPTAASTACDLLDETAIRSSLGDVADSVQPPQPDSERTTDGIDYNSCIYPFSVGGATTDALTVQRISYPSTGAGGRRDPYELLTEPEEITGLRHPAKYAKLDLSNSTEFVLVSFDGADATKLIVAMPRGTAWDKATGKASMLKLAHEADL